MISAILLCKNEIETLPKLLSYLKGWCQQILVVDTGSTDGSLEIARIHADVVQTDLNFDFSAARNYGMNYITEPWTFQVDCDEWPTESLLKWMDWKLPNSEAMAYKVQRYNTLDGEPGPNPWEWHIRIFRSQLRYVGRIHERVRINPFLVGKAPPHYYLIHAKTWDRQKRQDKFYENWREPCSLRPSDKQ